MKDLIKKIGPDVLAVLFFALLSFAYFAPAVMDGRVLTGHDNQAAVGAGHELTEYYQRTGEYPRWTNSIFGGMPTYQMSPSYPSMQKLNILERIYQLWLPPYVRYVFCSLLGFFIFLRAFNFKQWMAALGAVVWAFSSYFFIIIAAGHIWKVMALAYIPPTLAGIVLAYRGKYLWGGVVTAFFLALQILANHVQMSYYFLSVILAIALAYFIDALRQHTLPRFFKASAVLVVAALVGVAVNLSNLYHTYEYSKETMRGKSELVQQGVKAANQTSSGLERDYITQWSYGVDETLTLLIPNYKGGASVPLSRSEKAMAVADRTYMPVYQSMGQYWGTQPMTSGPVYVGAFVLMLFFFGLFIVKGPMKWTLFAVTVLTVLLSWGRNFMPFTDFFLDYVPMYDKFRAVSSILVVAEFTIPFLALLALKEWVEKPELRKPRLKYLAVSFVLTGGVALLCAVAPGLFGDGFMAPSEVSMLRGAEAQGYIPSEMMAGLFSNIQEMRAAVLSADAWRSFYVIVFGSVLMLLFYWKKVNPKVFVGSILLLCLVDMWDVNKRYLYDDLFTYPRPASNAIPMTATDQKILQDTTLDYRVLNMAGDTFNENNTAYYHKSIGGYHAAKLRRYQELIHSGIRGEMNRLWNAIAQTGGNLEAANVDSLCPVLNMLNTRYAIVSLQGGQTDAVLNPHANGNAWMVDRIKYVDSANDELAATCRQDSKHEAVADKRFESVLGSAAKADSEVKLDRYEANELQYSIRNSADGIVVFSEIYYPGWQATIDGHPAELGRVNYVLRALRVPAGNHEVRLWFDPVSIHTTEAIAYAALLLLLVAMLGGLGWNVYRRRKAA